MEKTQYLCIQQSFIVCCDQNQVCNVMQVPYPQCSLSRSNVVSLNRSEEQFCPPRSIWQSVEVILINPSNDGVECWIYIYYYAIEFTTLVKQDTTKQKLSVVPKEKPCHC